MIAPGSEIKDSVAGSANCAFRDRVENKRICSKVVSSAAQGIGSRTANEAICSTHTPKLVIAVAAGENVIGGIAN